jgi:penicillin V acylase-like amidase (Ntn superfamily)
LYEKKYVSLSAKNNKSERGVEVRIMQTSSKAEIIFMSGLFTWSSLFVSQVILNYRQPASHYIDVSAIVIRYGRMWREGGREAYTCIENLKRFL